MMPAAAIPLRASAPSQEGVGVDAAVLVDDVIHYHVDGHAVVLVQFPVM